MASLAKWLSVGLLTKWLWIRITLLSLKLQIRRLLWARSSSTFRQTIECRFTLKLVRDMIITYNQMHRTDKYSQHILIIWPVWLNGWVFVYELSGCGFESRWCHYCITFMVSIIILLLERPHKDLKQKDEEEVFADFSSFSLLSVEDLLLHHELLNSKYRYIPLT